ncbi:hypothetical protein [Mesorhizobium sp.]|uniref:hypothetical protein n=1 Tax=Mesorhizobium sp. TaxID=1871066 RepID=UPI000FE6770F|nr:hypothetical protein [Mesorhizobium sp.]RWK44378.1 MAG: hypothetical protein EOR46_00150 [Mesorhizobium sp.]RWK71603.1 MAG: hypothetical protein EOR54_01735 [Mesorhizobium sp.]RWK82070.1 MAG: hypothetical protein EOR50_01665 [Mesorhizobium sp.]RWK83040.1 MAG: hypothetical protein EOR51_10505 [Mesorhizobium sp.]RWL09590.1 MAG: hypothetical protein EOR55_01655 [Mesorhizobium sp.]
MFFDKTSTSTGREKSAIECWHALANAIRTARYEFEDVPPEAGFAKVPGFLFSEWNAISRQPFGGATLHCVTSGPTVRERQSFTHKEQHDRHERTSDDARALTDIERVARDAKTARLREQRLKAETALPAASAPKPKRNWKKL